MTFVLKTPPAVEPVTLADAKLHCREDTTDNDALITSLIMAARTYIDGPKAILNYCLVKQVWYAYFDAFPTGNSLRIDVWPIVSVDAVEYLDVNSAWQPMPPLNFATDTTAGNAWVVLASGASWPTPATTINSVRVTFTAGFNAPTVPVPSDLQLAIKMLVAHWYENRGVILDDRRLESLPMVFDALVAPYRRIAY